MNAGAGARVRDVRVTDDAVSVDLADGRTITAPLAWYPRLLHATPEQRANWRLAGGGYGIHWPEIDEDLGWRQKKDPTTSLNQCPTLPVPWYRVS